MITGNAATFSGNTTQDEELDKQTYPLKRNYYQGWMEPTGGQ